MFCDISGQVQVFNVLYNATLGSQQGSSLNLSISFQLPTCEGFICNINIKSTYRYTAYSPEPFCLLSALTFLTLTLTMSASNLHCIRGGRMCG